MALFDYFKPRQADAQERKHQFIYSGDFNSATMTRWGKQDYASRLLSGFKSNPIGYRSIRMISEGCASIPLAVNREGQKLVDHPVNTLLDEPNLQTCGQDFIEQLYLTLIAHGNAYIQRVRSELGERLHILRPDRMTLTTDASGWPISYDYRVDGKVIRFPADEVPSTILHLRFFDPLDDHYGMSPLEAASGAIAIHNAANAWNRSLFDNSARPSGALVYRGDGHNHLTDEQFQRLKRELEESFQGARNAGRPLLLEGGLDWSAISLSPQDMDFISAKHSAARDIALAFGVPPMLLGIPGDNTYANYAEANRAFWRHTLIPLSRRVTQSLGRFFAEIHPGVTLTCELDTVPALSEERRVLWERIQNADFLTIDEKRMAVGYGAREDS